MERAIKMQATLANFTMKAFGRKQTDAHCVICGSSKVYSIDFKDALSRKEFGISGMCQKCQDSVFGGDK